MKENATSFFMPVPYSEALLEASSLDGRGNLRVPYQGGVPGRRNLRGNFLSQMVPY